MRKIVLPEAVKKIINSLENAGFEAYAVGGCVRDSILGRTPNDWDITTNAKPEDVKKVFPVTIDTGIEHGTVTVRMNHESYEVTTYRIDGEYSDSRHPDSVEFAANLSEDLLRRDFTINAMAYSEKEGLVDLYGGEEDLENKVIRAVGTPLERFTEDALRIMRCVRFSAQLGFTIDEKTYIAAKALSQTLERISVERIREELLKILVSDHPDYLRILNDIGGLDTFFTEYENRKDAIDQAMLSVPNDKAMRLAAMFLRSGRDIPETYKIADRTLGYLKFDNDTRNAVLHLIRFHDVKLTTEPVMLRRFLNACGKESVEDLLTFMECTDGLDLSAVREAIQGILSRGECTCLHDMAISGKDLIGIGMLPGREMGETLMELLAEVLEKPELNTKEVLIQKAKERRGL